MEEGWVEEEMGERETGETGWVGWVRVVMDWVGWVRVVRGWVGWVREGWVREEGEREEEEWAGLGRVAAAGREAGWEAGVVVSRRWMSW